jgi:hypothetical protein
MLVHDAQIVQGPQGPVPSLVGLYDIHDKITQPDNARMVGTFLLCQSAIYGTYKFLPLISDWKARPFVGHPSTDSIECSVVQQIKSASHIVQGIPDDERGGTDRELPEECDEHMIAPFVFLNGHGVKIGIGKIGNELIQVMDVLHGPFNLFP